MIIDIHAHAFAFEQRVKCCLNNDFFPTARELIKRMDKLGIDKAVILPLVGAETPTEPQSIGEVLYICGQYPDRFIPFCCIDPRLPLPDNKITVTLFTGILDDYKRLGCKGFGEFIPRLPWNDRRVEMLLEACGEIGFPVIFHTTTPDTGLYGLLDYVGLPLLEQALEKFPKTKFLGHSPAFWSEISGDVNEATKHIYTDGKITAGGAVVRLMEKHPNLYGDLSAGSGYNALTRDTDFTWKFLERFQDRLLFGQDVCCRAHDFQHKQFLTQAVDQGSISREIHEKIMWKNAAGLLDL
jgi:uncharacterized protein